jgi:hypothetical protein
MRENITKENQPRNGFDPLAYIPKHTMRGYSFIVEESA